jgi:hypothetical protein
MADSRTQTAPREPLNDFANRWELDGDYIRCRACNRPQIVSCALWDFRHAAGCRNESAERNPWLSLSGLITAHLARASRPVCEDVANG